MKSKVSGEYRTKQEISHTLIESVESVESVELVSEVKNDSLNVSLSDSLKQADAHLIQKYLVKFNGNVSQVAKRLKVSRGLIYRRLQLLSIDPALFKKK
jgi:DNA-binding NtrC family response regulator